MCAKSTKSNARPRIVIAVNTAADYERRIIAGVIRWARLHPEWEYLFEARSASLVSKLELVQAADGAVVHAGSGDTTALWEQIKRLGCPVTTVETYGLNQPPPAYPRVLGDNAAIGRLAFKHLRSKGFDRLAFVGMHGPAPFDQRREAFEASAQAAIEAGQSHVELLSSPPPVQTGTFMAGHERCSLRQWLSESSKPLGVFAANIELARHIAIEARRCQIVVPEELAILGCDADALIAELSNPPLSTIDHGMERAGYEAAGLLARMLDGQPGPSADQPILIEPTGLIERQSTDTLAVEDPDVRHAVQFIRRHATEGIDVGDVLREVPTGRRTLELAFNRHLGRTVYNEITRIRVEWAAKLLETTTLAMPEIAARSGFSHATRLNEAFARVYRYTPGQHRKRRG